MVRHILHLRLATPSVQVILDTHAQEIWNRICFFEDAQQYDQYDQAWEELLSYLQDDIQQEVWDDLTVDDAVVSVG